MTFEILNYEVIRKIGEGGMGQVFLARNKSIHQFVAIKMLHPQYSADPTLRDRFRQEAIMLSSLDHPNIVKFLNYVENDQGIFLIMEYVDGMTLEDFITKKNGLIVEERAYPMMSQILDAFAYAHLRGIVHRDIKPSNIFISKEGQIKVLDFGIAHILSDANESREVGRGSLIYMSPEQVHGQKLDIRSDIYSLGVVFYQMLTGRVPYDLNSLTNVEIKKRIVESPLPRLKEAYPYISDYMQSVVDRATQKSPEYRFESCVDFRKALNHAREENLRHAGQTPDNVDGHDRHSGKKSSKGIWIAVITILAVIAVGLLGYWTYDRNRVKNYEWYSDFNGIAQGISSTGSTDAHYELDYSNGRLQRLLLVASKDSSEARVDSVYDLYRPVEVEYFYDDNGDLSYKKVYDSYGKALYKATYSSDMKKVHVDREQTDSTSVTVSDFVLEYDTQGRVSKASYVDENGSFMPDADKIFSEKYTYDNNGRLLRVSFFDSEDAAAARADGVSMISFEYDGPGVVRTRYYDVKGSAVTPEAANKPASGVKTAASMKSKNSGKLKKKEYNKADSVSSINKLNSINKSEREISASENMKKVLKSVR